MKELADKLGVPLEDDGFIEEKHVKLDPVNTLNQAAFSAGCALGPKDIHDSVTEGISAAHKVSQFLGKGMILIPPEKPMILECNGCGDCTKACPIKGIEIRNFTRNQLKAQLKAILSEGHGVIVFIDPYAYAAFEYGAAGVLLIEGTMDKKLTSCSDELYKKLKTEMRKHKKPLRYSHIETAQYEKLTDLLNVFAKQAGAKAEKRSKKSANIDSESVNTIQQEQ